MATKLGGELAGLATMPRDELVERWRAIYGCPPPAGARRELLIYAAGWHLQARRLGGFSAEARRMLRREVERIRRDCGIGGSVPSRDAHAGEQHVTAEGDPARTALDTNDDPSSLKPAVVRRKLVPGSRLLRDWNGRTHAVDVTENGYIHEGTTYRSLSAIARRITGAHWSGPRFFGL